MSENVRNLLYGFMAGDAYGRARSASKEYPADDNIDGRPINSWGDHTDQILAVLSAIHMNRSAAYLLKYNDIYKTIVAKYKSSSTQIILKTDLAKTMAETAASFKDFAGQFSGQTFADNYDAIPRAIVAGCLSRFRKNGYLIAIHLCKLTHNTSHTLWSFIFVARVVSAIVFAEHPLDLFNTIFQESLSKIGKLPEHLTGTALCVFPEVNRCIATLKAAIPLLDPTNYEEDANVLWTSIVSDHVTGADDSAFVGGLVGAIAAAVLKITPAATQHLPGASRHGIVDLFVNWHAQKNNS